MFKRFVEWLRGVFASRLDLSPVLTLVKFNTGAVVAPLGLGSAGPGIVLNRANGGRKPIKIELLVLDDLTESALNRAQVIADTTRTAFETLERSALQVQFGYIGCRDRDYGEADEVRITHGTSAQVLREQLTVVRAGGGDPAEPFGDSVLDALDSYPFTNAPDVAGAIVLLCTDHSKPTRSGLTPFQVGERCKAARKHIFVVGEPDSNTEDFVRGAGAFGGGFMELKASPTEAEVKFIAQKLTGTLVGTLSGVATGTVPPKTQTQRPSGSTVPAP